MDRVFGALGRGVVRFRWVVVIVWIVGTIFAVKTLPSLSSQVNSNNSDFLPSSALSVKAANLAEPVIGSDSTSQIPVVVVSSRGSLDNPTDQDAIASLKQTLRVPSVTDVNSLGLSKSGNAAQLLVTSTVNPFDQSGSTTLVNHLNAAIDQANIPSNLSVNLAGEEATDVANQKQSEKQGNQIQLASIIFIIILLLVIFRAFLAPFITLLPAVFALTLSGVMIGALGAHGLKISGITQILLIVLILGAGTDYGLFLVFRVREALLGGSEPKEAVAFAVMRVGESISASATTVVVALLSLLFASFGIYHDLAIPLSIGIAVMLLAGLTLLPALMTIFGRAVFYPSRTKARDHKDGAWGRIAGRLVRRPALTLSIGLVALGALSLFALAYKPGGFGGEAGAPAGSSAARGNAALLANFPQASENPTNVVMGFDQSVWDNPAVLQKVTDELAATRSFNKVAGPLNSTGVQLSADQLISLHHELGDAKDLPVPQPASSTVPPAQYYAYVATARYISANGKVAQWEVGLEAGDPASTAALHAVPQMRDDVAAVAKNVGASANGVAGEAPALYDVSSISDSDLRHIIPIAVIVIGIVLALVLRSLVAPLYLIASVVLSYLASLGLSVIVFIKLGGSAGITFLLPFLMFIFLLALGEDYNILVMTRIREEAARLPLREAVVRAVGATGPTVTSAGLVLAGSFGVLAVVGGSGPGNSQVRAIGFGLAIGILLDTFVVRTVLVPSTVALLGRWNWWPSKMSQLSAGPPGEPGSGPALDAPDAPLPTAPRAAPIGVGVDGSPPSTEGVLP